MGLIRWLFGGGLGAAGAAIEGVAGAFRPNAEADAQRQAAYQQAALAQLTAEYAVVRPGVLNRLVDFLNRLPRPMLALGTLGLFVFAMAWPEEFALRMAALDHVPDQLWWLLGAIVSFYFGAREAHYFRKSRSAGPTASRKASRRPDKALVDSPVRPVREPTSGPNAALDAWQRQNSEIAA
ncbi:MAG: 3TM-type holin [Pseudomonadota bacterium]